ncbi:hypothetical protein ACFLYH_00345 [Candidatus Dependentiae bacterium]
MQNEIARKKKDLIAMKKQFNSVKKNRFCFFVIFFLCIYCLGTISSKTVSKHNAVTYTFSGGRFGDNLLAYMRAKWVSYKYNMILLYKPFQYSDQLVMDEQEQKFSSKMQKKYTDIVTLTGKTVINKDQKKQVLYVLDFYKSNGFLRKHPIDWQDEDFIQELRKFIAPKNAFAKMNLPEDRISVAVHVRKGRYEGSEGRLRELFPDKFMEEKYYIDQLKKVHQMFAGTPLYVYIFTDDSNPRSIKERFEKQFTQDYNIQFDCRTSGNNHDSNVLYDFFAFNQFDCFIHGLSNFARCASCLAYNYLDIQPVFGRVDGKLVVTEVKFIENESLKPELI